jgi:anti-sigma B factor antagonist
MLVFEGTLDLATVPLAMDWLQRVLNDHGPHLAVDTSRLDFIDSKGVGALLAGAKAARDAGGQLYLPNPALPVRKILEMCGLTSLFPTIHPEPQGTEPAPPVLADSRSGPRAAAPARSTRKAA